MVENPGRVARDGGGRKLPGCRRAPPPQTLQQINQFKENDLVSAASRVCLVRSVRGAVSFIQALSVPTSAFLPVSASPLLPSPSSPLPLFPSLSSTLSIPPLCSSLPPLSISPSALFPVSASPYLSPSSPPCLLSTPPPLPIVVSLSYSIFIPSPLLPPLFLSLRVSHSLHPPFCISFSLGLLPPLSPTTISPHPFSPTLKHAVMLIYTNM